MHTHAISRFLVSTLVLSIFAIGLFNAPKASADTTEWMDGDSRENVFVEACEGFNITSSYTTNRQHRVVAEYTGDTVFERLQMSFSGALANSTTGQSLPYEGQFVRTSDYNRNMVEVSDFVLRLGQPAGLVTVTIARQGLDLVDNPVDVFLAFAPRIVSTSLCGLLGGSVTGNAGGAESNQSIDPTSIVHDLCTGPHREAHPPC